MYAWIVQAIGESTFRAVFSLASAVGLAWLIWSYAAAGPIQSLWVTPRGVIVLCMLLMLPALVLFVGSVKTPNSTMLQGQRALKVENPARGVLRMTRHPILWSFAIWAGVGISDKTLYRHRANLMEKLGARSPGDLSRIARERGLLADLG